MFTSNSQIVWMPEFVRGALAISLKREFAIACINYQHKDLRQFTEQVWTRAGHELPLTPSNFLHIKQGILPAGIYYKPGDGMWLTTDGQLSNADWALAYSVHNDDKNIHDHMWFIAAFAAWVEVAQITVDWK